MDSKEKDKWKGLKRVVAAIAAFLAGIANGLFGGGGGMLVVPTLGKVMNLEEKRAHATAIAVMLPISTVSAVAYLLRGVHDWPITLSVGSGVVVGGMIGAMLLKKVPRGMLSTIFYGVMIYVGIRFVLK